MTATLQTGNETAGTPPVRVQRLVRGHGLTHLDLFSGIGGFALAAKAAGFQTIGFSEIDPYACKIIKRHFPDVPNYGDVGNVPTNLRARLITGGFPCQPYSISNQSKREDDPRKLWPKMLGLVEAIRPEWVLGENVAQFANLGLDGVASDLEAANYAVEAFILPALSVGAIHRRDRVWIIGHSNSERLEESGNQHDGAKWNAASAVQWPTESPICRTTDGVSDWVDRMHGLGNAIVPQVAEVILREMKRMTSNGKLTPPPPTKDSLC